MSSLERDRGQVQWRRGGLQQNGPLQERVSNYSCRPRTEQGVGVLFSVEYSPVVSFRSGFSYKVAVALSLFLGWLGADRFYLGYPALGKE